ncbi:hypothetical protein [Aquimarina macrocephali]|uniref:hypothetical protein n=1 Tax=Aquimarina macrocephali TaxID=666563 RepID=UPI000465A3D3|nr:hypothetical protein [Aquimarina macrocephali]
MRFKDIIFCTYLGIIGVFLGWVFFYIVFEIKDGFGIWGAPFWFFFIAIFMHVVKTYVPKIPHNMHIKSLVIGMAVGMILSSIIEA